MGTRQAKEVIHLRDWLDIAADIVAQGREACASDRLLQEAGDSLMMKIGETASRLRRAAFPSPPGVAWQDAIDNRNWLIHQYDHLDRQITWETLAADLPAWRQGLGALITEAEKQLRL